MDKLVPTRKLAWSEAAERAQDFVKEVLHKEIPCQMALEDDTYWTLYSPTYKFPTQELEQLLQAVSATKAAWEEAIPQEGEASCSLGMELSPPASQTSPSRRVVPGALHGRGPMAAGLPRVPRGGAKGNLGFSFPAPISLFPGLALKESCWTIWIATETHIPT